MDPLSLVREYVLTGKAAEIKTLGDDVDFGGRYVFPKGSFTAFRSHRDYCTLEVVLWVLNTKVMPHAEYLRSTAQAKLTSLPLPDRKKLLDFLEGKLDLQLEKGSSLPLLPKQVPREPDAAEPATKRPKLAGGHGVLVERQYERQLRDRNSMLLAPTKEFTRVLDIADRVYSQLSSMLRQRQLEIDGPSKSSKGAGTPHKSSRPDAGSKRGAGTSTTPGAPGASAQPRSSRFDRDATTEQLRIFGGDAATGLDSVINMYGRHKDTAPAAGTAQGAGTAAPPLPGGAPPLPGAAAPPRPGSSAARESSGSGRPHQKPSAGGARLSGAPPGRGGALAMPAAVARPVDKLRGAKPIILVPSGMTSMINMYNAATLLGEGRFVTVAAAQKACQTKDSSTTIKRSVGKVAGKETEYIITDKTPAKGSPDWGRVVAVVVQGVKWQFKDWPFKGAAEGDLLETFLKVAGFYVHYSDDKVTDPVASWNVQRLALARDKRHMDMPVMLEFFKHLDIFLSGNRSTLAY